MDDRRSELKKVSVSGKRDVDEFKKFHDLLMMNAPEGYVPHYIRLKSDGKDPVLGKGWKTKEGRLAVEDACEWLKKNGNIGIAAMESDTLVIEDIDDQTRTEWSTLKSTLTSQTARVMGKHLFYFEPFSGMIPNVPTSDESGEIRANNQYVVAPGSYVSEYEEEEPQLDGMGQYKVCIKKPCSMINSVDELAPVFIEQMEKNKKARLEQERKKAKREQLKKGAIKSDASVSMLFTINIHDVIAGLPGDPYERFPSLFHGSRTGENTSVSGELLHCWRDHVSLNAIQALTVLSGFYTCEEAGSAHKDSGGTPSAVTYNDKAIFVAWRYAKEHDIIPLDDPIPSAAMRYTALSEGFCDKSEIGDGWKLPIAVFNKVLSHCKSIGLDPGRKHLTTEKKKSDGVSKTEGEEKDTRLIPFEYGDVDYGEVLELIDDGPSVRVGKIKIKPLPELLAHSGRADAICNITRANGGDARL